MKNRLLLFAGAAVLLAGLIVSRHHTLTKAATQQQEANHTEKGRAARAEQSGAASDAGESDPSLNPYAGALKQRGTEKRAWEGDFLAAFQNAASNSPVEFELTSGTYASGQLKIVQVREGQVSYISGELTKPETGTFFFLAPPPGSKAGRIAGVVEFPASQSAYRVEPTGLNGEPELWKRRLDEVRCETMPLIDPARTGEVAEMPPLRPDLVPDYAPDYNSNIVSLQSYPGAAGVLLLDFFGGYTPTWGGVTYPRPSVSNSQIKDLWKRVAEDYMPFNVNVTTDIRVYLNAPTASRQKVVFTPTTSAMPGGAAGVAYIGSWNWGSDTVCWSIYTSGKAGGEVGSHEAGHTLGLGHQGTSTSGYFSGQGSGVTGWAPIMGAGYYDAVVTWAKGEYNDANNHEDELNIITTQNNNVGYRGDDTGSTLATSRYLEVYPGNTASGEGVIERTGDTDAFQFTTGGGLVSLTANPVGDWADLAISATLANGADVVVATNNPQSSLSASIVVNVTPGTYTFRVTGAGRNNPLSNGFSSYASLGYYSITGSVAAARLPTRLSVAEHSPNGTLVGVVPANSPNSRFSYSIASGNPGGGTFSIDSRGVVRVSNNALLDYNRYATNTMLPVQFELFVNITDLTDPSLNEGNRRVVIALLNVNDAPFVTGFTATIVDHTKPGTPIGTVSVRDADFLETLSFSIVSGDPQQKFAIDQNGTLLVGSDLSAAAQSVYTLGIAVNDNVLVNPLTATGTVTINVVSNRTWFQPGSISYALYDNIGSGTTIGDLTSNTRWPRDPSSERQMPSFEGLLNRADNYGAAMRGYLIAPQSGTYTFWIASDDSGELWMSTTTNNASLTRIAYVNGYTSWRQWTKYTSQQSTAISLVAGQGYYIEARMKEGGGGDHVSVAWKGPPTGNQTNIIPGLYLAPYLMNYMPHVSSATASVHQGAYTGTAITTLALSDVNASDAHFFSITSGNSGGLFAIDNGGTLRVADQAALLASAIGPYTLQVLVNDSGTPSLSASASVTVNVVSGASLADNSLRREIWNNIGGGTAVSDLTNNPAFPRRPDELEVLNGFASSVDHADNYGSRIRALVKPSTTGVYRFFIASDDNSSLYLSTDATPTHAARIAYVPNWTAANTWTTYAQQMSASINLVAGQAYYIEALQKEGGGGDHVSVAWAGPGIVDGSGLSATNIIDGAFLSPVDLNYAPQISSQALPVSSAIPNNTPVGRVMATDSSLDALTYKIVDGNTNNMFTIDPSTGIIAVSDNTLIANKTMTSFPLTVAVQDSGYNGLYAPQSSQATVTINVQAAGASSFVWTGADPASDWAAAGNWGGLAPSDGARLIFGFPSQQSNLNDWLSSVSWVQFTNGGFSISGGGLSLQSGMTNRGDNTWKVDTTLAAAQTWNNLSGTLNVSGAISNNGSTWVLIAGGDVRVSGPVSGGGGLNKSGTARLLMQGTHFYTGGTVIASAGASATALEVNGVEDLDIGYSDLTMNGRMDLGSHDAIVGALGGNGVIFANDLTRTLTVGANGHSATFQGLIQNTSSGSGVTLNLVKTGAGTQTLSGANTYSGLTVVRNGVLLAMNSSALGSAVGATVVRPGATLALGNNIGINAEPLTLNGDGANGTGALRNEAGMNYFNGPISLGSAATIRAAAGTLTLGGQWNTAGFNSSLTFDTAAGTAISVSAGISGGGSLIKRGAGTLILSGTDYYMGPTLLAEGQLTALSQGAFAWSSSISLQSGAILDVTALFPAVTIGSGQTLQGEGTINGSVMVDGRLSVDGTLVNDVSLGTLRVTGNVTLSGTTAFEISKQAGVLTNDLLSCGGSLALGGLLTVTANTGGAAQLVVGDSFKLLEASNLSGSFNNYSLPGLPPGLAWDVSRLNVDGTLRVEPSSPPFLVLALNGQTMNISWPAGYSSYALEGQTNPAGQGLSPSWYTVPAVTNNAVSFPWDPSVGSVFYRLIHQP